MKKIFEEFSAAGLCLCLALGAPYMAIRALDYYATKQLEQEVAERKAFALKQVPEISSELKVKASEVKQLKPDPRVVWNKPKGKAIHLCIDVQKVYPQIHDLPWWGDMKEKIVTLDKELEKREIPTVYVAFNSRFKPLPKGVDQWKNVPVQTLHKLEESGGYKNFDFPLNGEQLVAFKTDYSAFKQKEIASYIKKNGYRTIILSGVWEGELGEKASAYCVSETARDFRRAGYEVVIVKEATQRGMIEANEYQPLVNRIRFHNQWGVKVVPFNTLLSGLDHKGKTESKVAEKKVVPAKKMAKEQPKERVGKSPKVSMAMSYADRLAA